MSRKLFHSGSRDIYPQEAKDNPMLPVELSFSGLQSYAQINTPYLSTSVLFENPQERTVAIDASASLISVASFVPQRRSPSSLQAHIINWDDMINSASPDDEAISGVSTKTNASSMLDLLRRGVSLNDDV